MNVFQYRSVWPDGRVHIEPTLDRAAFFTEFDHAINLLNIVGVGQPDTPRVEVQTLETVVVSPWKTYGAHISEQINASRKA